MQKEWSLAGHIPMRIHMRLMDLANMSVRRASVAVAAMGTGLIACAEIVPRFLKYPGLSPGLLWLKARSTASPATVRGSTTAVASLFRITRAVWTVARYAKEQVR